jgi:hypothetical protein
MMRALPFAMLLVLGCNNGPTIFHVEGMVTYKGQPLPKGVIYFDPDPRQGNDGPQGHAIITDGKYTTRGELGKGVVGGAYIIRIEGFDGKPGNELPLGKPLFTSFSETRSLEAADQTQDFTITK